jgi:hypothetical protein
VGSILVSVQEGNEAVGGGIGDCGYEEVLEEAGRAMLHNDKFIGQEDRADDEDFDDKLGTLTHILKMIGL